MKRLFPQLCKQWAMALDSSVGRNWETICFPPFILVEIPSVVYPESHCPG